MRRIFVAERGDHATARTLELMRDVVNRSLLERPEIIEQAVDVVRYVDGRNTSALADALERWITARVQFLPDPNIDGDVLRTPAYCLDQIRRFGVARIDCDDAAMLTAALAKSVGLNVRFAVFAFFAPDAPYSHVATEIDTDRGPRLLDVTEPLERRMPPSRVGFLEV